MPFGFLTQHRLYILRAANKAVQVLQVFAVSNPELKASEQDSLPLKKVPGEREKTEAWCLTSIVEVTPLQIKHQFQNELSCQSLFLSKHPLSWKANYNQKR